MIDYSEFRKFDKMDVLLLESYLLTRIYELNSRMKETEGYEYSKNWAKKKYTLLDAGKLNSLRNYNHWWDPRSSPHIFITYNTEYFSRDLQRELIEELKKIERRKEIALKK